MAKTSVDIPQLKFNKMSSAKYEELKLAGQLNDNEFYITPDGGTIPEVNETTNDFVLSNNGTDLNWIQETEYTKNRIDSKLNDNVRTNCITKIPQDIKLELSNGTLTRKAGSMFYIPDGFNEDGITKKFKTLITSEDASVFGSVNLSNLVNVLNPNNLSDFPRVDKIACFSGDTPPSGYQTMFWYDTANNFVKLTTDSGNSWDVGYSLPYAITSETTSGFTSINQVFNGFGYIGSTIFALPGVEGLIPNRRNTDGSLNNTKFTTTSVQTKTYPSNVKTGTVFLTSGSLGAVPEWYYDSNKNIITDGSEPHYYTEVGYLIVDSTGKITSFSPKLCFQAVDRNDTEWASTAGKPSSRYVDLTLQASDTVYTTPANGRFMLAKKSNALGEEIRFKNLSSNIWGYAVSTGGRTISATISVKKGDSVGLFYSASGETEYFRFVYDEGAR